ncbi:hypothetical protein GIB67_009997 [Kingdonia uniflora]|uniref:Uncharacterized protein n=1 Tax=Kingdonia uniflora TaxID=39325 RepID=A0A7J7P0V1_9MAGN|nr:hypothetical protein GIB67_009997 [Kingdonia uniflora]
MRQDLSGDGCNGQMSNDEGNFTNKKSTYSVDFARMKIENATLKESRDNVEHLTSAIHKLRISLLKAVQDYATLGSSGSSTVIKLVDDIIADVNVLKIALGSCLPVSWSAEAKPEDPTDGCGDFASEKLDFVSAAGFEMVELLMLAAQILKENIIGKSFSLFA